MHGALGDFLPRTRRDVAFDITFELPVGLRDLIQSTGVPHVEVDRIEIDGAAADWSRVVDDGARVEAHPRYPLEAAPAEPRFLLDAHLGKLTAYLRLVGIDSAHDPEVDDPELVEWSLDEDRGLLTRDRGLLMHGSLRYGSYVREIDPVSQAVEVVRRFALRSVAAPFTRCMACNGVLGSAGPNDVAGRVPTGVAARHSEFRCCPDCERVYWEGSHHRRLRTLVREITA